MLKDEAKEEAKEENLEEMDKPKHKVGDTRADGYRFWMRYKTQAGWKEYWVTPEKFGHYIGVKKAATKAWNCREKESETSIDAPNSAPTF